MTKHNFTVVLIITAIILGWYFLSSRPSQPNQAPQVTQAQKVQEVLIAVSNQGFNPKNVTIKTGESITWVNEDTAAHTVNSSGYPEHLAYPPLNTIGVLKPGEKKSLSFPEPRTYEYHDHLNHTLIGSVVVE